MYKVQEKPGYWLGLQLHSERRWGWRNVHTWQSPSTSSQQELPGISSILVQNPVWKMKIWHYPAANESYSLSWSLHAHNKSQYAYGVWVDILLVLDATVQRTVMSCNAIFKCMKIKRLDTNKVQVPKKKCLHFKTFLCAIFAIVIRWHCSWMTCCSYFEISGIL